MAGRKIIKKLIDDGLSLANQAPAYPIILNRADPATEVLRGRAAQMLLPKADRMKPIGPQFFDTSQKAYEETLTRVPQEDFMHMLPQPVYGRDLPKNNRLVPILENFDDVARVYADKMRPFVNKNVGYFYHTAPMYKKTEDLLQSDLAANEFMDRFSKAYAGSSPRTATEQNLLNASLLNYRDLEGLDLGYPVLNRAGNNDVGYPMISGMHPDLTRRLLAEEPTFLNNPKPTSFTENVRGNLQGITADTHNIRGILVSYDELFPGKIPREWFKNEDAYRMYREGGLTPAILKGGIDDSLGSQTVGGVSRQSEYGPIAEITERSANILGVPPAMGQSLGWFGLGNMTNLKSAPKTLTELTGDRLNITSQYLGEDPDRVFKMFSQGQIPLMNQGGRVGEDADIEAALMTARTEKSGGGAKILEFLKSVGAPAREGLQPLRPEGSGYIPVPNKPGIVDIPLIGRVEARPIEALEQAASKYMAGIGKPGEGRIKAFDPSDKAKQTRIADAFERMKHDPYDPEVARSYDAMIQETMDQYKALEDLGLDIRFNKGDDPYGLSPSMGYADLSENGRLFVFPTDTGFGYGTNEFPDNPLLTRVGKIGDLEDATANDAFRAVHDIFGHFAPGNPYFRGAGEDRAWFAHSKMYSDDAIPAMTNETRGQNSWVNYGPHGEFNSTANGLNTIYAPQKIGKLPRFSYDKNRGGSVDGRIHKQYGGGGGGLKKQTVMGLIEFLTKTMGRDEAIKIATDLAARETRAAAADKLVRSKLLEQTKMTGDGKSFAPFFDEVTRGSNEQFIPSNLENYQGAITLNPDQEAFKRMRQKYSGNFDNHIRTSIPGFDEVQNAVGNAVIKTLPQGGSFFDMASSEGALLKAIVEGSGGRIRAHGIDPNVGMYDTFNAKPIPAGATMERSAFGAPEDYGKLAWPADGTEPATNYFNPQDPFDIAHEAMGFQFISNARKPQIEAMKSVLKPGGLMISEEKFGNVAPLYNFNEAQKDLYKSQFYTPEQLETKRQKVLLRGGDEVEGMNDLQVSQDEMDRILADTYGHRAQFWDSGNFKGYAASDDKYLLDDFLGNLGDLSSKYETEVMPRRFADGGAVDSALRIARDNGGGITPFSTPDMVRRSDLMRSGDDTDFDLLSSYSDDAIADLAAGYNMQQYIQDVHGGRPQPEATLSSHTPTLREQLIAMVPERDKVNIDRAYGAAELTGLPQFGEAHNRFIRTGESPSFGDQAMMAVDMAPGVLLAGAKPIYQGLKAGYQAAKPALSKVGLPTAVGALGLTAGADEAEAGIFGEAATKLLGEEGLNLAKRMYDEGASMAEIEAATNWYAPRKTSYAYDKLGNETKVPSIGAWRTYIDPKNARFAERKISNMPTSLKNVLEWPEFEAVYPGLMHTLNVVPYAKTRGGYFDQGRMMIGVGDVNHDFYRPFGGNPYQNVLMHELEHAVQGRSAFSSGSSPEVAAHEYQIRAGDLGEYDLGNEIYNTPLKMGYYYANPGEAEARNVANRFANPELRSLPIEATEDVPTSVRLPDYGGQAELEDILRVKDWWNSPEGQGLMEGQPILNKDRP